MRIARLVVSLILLWTSAGGCIGGSDDESAFCDVLATDLWVRQNDGEPVDVIVFVEPDASEDQAQDALDEVEGDPAVVSVTFVDQEEAYDELTEIFADTPEMIEQVSAENLPPSIRVDLAPEAEHEMEAWASQFEDDPGVFRVVTADTAFMGGRLLVDAVVRPMTVDPGGGATVVQGTTPEVLDELADAAPDEHAGDVETIRAALEEQRPDGSNMVELTPELMEAARSITAYHDTRCVAS